MAAPLPWANGMSMVEVKSVKQFAAASVAALVDRMRLRSNSYRVAETLLVCRRRLSACVSGTLKLSLAAAVVMSLGNTTNEANDGLSLARLARSDDASD